MTHKIHKFKLVMIDDEYWNSSDGCGLVLQMLQNMGFLEKRANPRIPAVDDGSFAMAYTLLTPDTGYTFDDAMTYVKDHQASIDIFFSDIKMDSEIFRPRDNRERRYVEKNVEELADGEVSLYAAGIEFINVLDRNLKPKIFFSGAPETNLLITCRNLFASRLDDIILDKIDSPGFRENLEMTIDRYLRHYQLVTIRRQSYEKRTALRNRIYKKDPHADWDTPDIEYNDGERIVYWSLRTLFPKQINRIERGAADSDEMAGCIESILWVDWRVQMRGFLNHPLERAFKNRNDLKTARRFVYGLDFKTESNARIYKRITALPDYKDKAAVPNLRDKILKARINHQPPDRAYLLDYFYPGKENSDDGSISLVDYFRKLAPEENWVENWESICRNIGIYPPEIAYISHIAHHNTRHLLDCPPPQFRFRFEAGGRAVAFSWHYERPASPDIFNSSSKLYEKFDAANKHSATLRDAGMTDIAKIVCWHYLGTVRFTSGNHRMEVKKSQQIEVSIVSLEAAYPGTELRIYIEAPEVSGLNHE